MTVAITGWGCVTPLGVGARLLYERWRDGHRAIEPIRRFDTSALACHVGGEMPDPPDGPGARGARHLRLALAEALWKSPLPAGTPVLALVATTKGFLDRGGMLEERDLDASGGAPARFLEDDLRRTYGLAPRAWTVSTACASGVAALSVALAALRRPDAPAAVLCAGVDLLSDFVFRGFASLGALDEEPCRPFDLRRAGLSAAEAAGVILLEDEDRARARGAPVLGRLLAAGLANDALHPTAPSRDGAGMLRAIEDALAAAGVAPAALGHVHAHGTGTLFNDSMEIRALGAALGASARRIPVTTLKGSTGHAFGAAAIVETIASLEAVREGVLPAIGGLALPEGRLDVLTAPRRLQRPHFLKTSAGFGGFCGALVAEGCAR
jgi:3-oxoacyl-[acyl-carrier-protein] synthase II